MANKEAMTILDAPVNQWLRLKAIHPKHNFHQRLYEMGFHLGDQVLIQQRLPWSGPIIVSLGDCTVALRVEEASCLEFESIL